MYISEKYINEATDGQKARRNRVRRMKAVEKGKYETLKVDKSDASLRKDSITAKRAEREMRRSKDRMDYYNSMLERMPGSAKKDRGRAIGGVRVTS